MGTRMAEELLFSYEDIDMYERDVNLLTEGNWLNDSCISFGFKHILSKYNDGGIISFMDASVMSFMMLQASDEEDMAALRGSLRLEAITWLGVPINDNTGFGSTSTHWSFLLCHTLSGDMWHCDSAAPHNKSAAQCVAAKVATLLGRHTLRIEEQEAVPQQRNGTDCGIFTLLFAEAVLDCVLPQVPLCDEGATEKEQQRPGSQACGCSLPGLGAALQRRCVPGAAAQLRHELLLRAEELREEAKRASRSRAADTAR